MDVVTQSLLKEFAESQKIESLGVSDQFEAFINYIVVADIYPEEFDFNVVSTGQGEFGIDGLAIIVNDAIVDDEEQLDDIIAHNPVLQIQFLFVQAKSSSFFDSGDLSKWPAPGSEDTELGVFMGPEVRHGTTKIYPGIQA
jgi:hypothetical protein